MKPSAPDTCLHCHRRRFLQRALMGSAALFTVPGAFAETLVQTPSQTEGPYYPDKYPLDTDNDLLIINDSITPAVGEITHLTGTVRNVNGEPVKNALVEIWQVDQYGNYIHTRGANRRAEEKDGNFQGYGRFVTDLKGGYYFRTIKPTTYPGRTPHIHVAVSQGEQRMLTTQCYVKGEPQNERDGILGRITGQQRDNVVLAYTPIPNSPANELAANFDIVIGLTPDDQPRGGRGPGDRDRQRPRDNA